jgi:hypothetical protein
MDKRGKERGYGRQNNIGFISKHIRRGCSATGMSFCGAVGVLGMNEGFSSRLRTHGAHHLILTIPISVKFYSSQLLRSVTASGVKGMVGMVVLHGDPG